MNSFTGLFVISKYSILIIGFACWNFHTIICCEIYQLFNYFALEIFFSKISNLSIAVPVLLDKQIVWSVIINPLHKNSSLPKKHNSIWYYYINIDIYSNPQGNIRYFSDSDIIIISVYATYRIIDIWYYICNVYIFSSNTLINSKVISLIIFSKFLLSLRYTSISLGTSVIAIPYIDIKFTIVLQLYNCEHIHQK